MFWLLWVIIFVPVILALVFSGASEKVVVPVILGGTAIFLFFELRSVFSAFGSSNTFFGEGKTARKILENGRGAIATVIALGENSKGGVVTINDQPLLNLKLLIADGQNPAYEVSFDTIIGRADVPQFQPGTKFKVKIDPADPQRVVLDGRATAEKSVIGKKDWTDEDRQLLQKQGLTGVAKLLDVEDTGRSENFEPVIKLKWEIQCAKWGTYITESEFPAASMAAEQLKTVIGQSFSARIMPNNKDKLTVDVKF